MSPALMRGVVSGPMIPSSDGTITGCRHNQSGALRIIDAEAGQTCKASETQLTWKEGIHGKVADSDKLDGLDSTNLLPDGDLPAGTTLRGRYDSFGNTTGQGDNTLGGDGISYVYPLDSVRRGKSFRRAQLNPWPGVPARLALR